MSDLAAFLTARLNEDEAVASAVSTSTWVWPSARSKAADAFTAHVARHDPARVLREVELKRALLNEHRMTAGWSTDNWHRTLFLLAGIYSDHPDYDPEWNPDF